MCVHKRVSDCVCACICAIQVVFADYVCILDFSYKFQFSFIEGMDSSIVLRLIFLTVVGLWHSLHAKLFYYISLQSLYAKLFN